MCALMQCYSHSRRWPNYKTLARLFREIGLALGCWSYPDPANPSVPSDPNGQYQVYLYTTKREAHQGCFDLMVEPLYPVSPESEGDWERLYESGFDKGDI